MCETLVFEGRDRRGDHRRLSETHDHQAPHRDDVFVPLGGVRGGRDRLGISDLAITSTRSICSYPGTSTPTLKSSDISLARTRTERLHGPFEKVGATRHLSGPGASACFGKSLSERTGIRLEYKTCDYGGYAESWAGSDAHSSALDPIAKCGLAARESVRGRTADRVIVSGRAECLIR
jgi:hypothetical protein